MSAGFVSLRREQTRRWRVSEEKMLKTVLGYEGEISSTVYISG
jgi:hypothetical protein